MESSTRSCRDGGAARARAGWRQGSIASARGAPPSSGSAGSAGAGRLHAKIAHERTSARKGPTGRCGGTSGCSDRCSGACSSSRRARAFLATEERIRASARALARGRRPVGRPRGGAGSSRRAARRGCCARSPLYFQLANTAEQHHRIRRRRAYAEEVETPRESLAEAFERLAGVPAEHASPPARARLARARPHRAPDGGDPADAAAGARPDRGAADAPGRPRPDGGRARRARGRARRGDHDPLADRRGAQRAAARRRRDPARALVLRGEPVRRGRAAAARVPAARSRRCRCRSRSAAGSAATSTGTPRSAARRSSAALERARETALARYRADVLRARATRSRPSRSLVGVSPELEGVDRARRARAARYARRARCR